MIQTYSSLDPNRKEIRTLRVEPGSRKDPIECSLTHASLADHIKPEYETISYVWGDAKLRSKISLDGIEVEVPSSSQRVLRRMRHPDRPRTLWIDAICINQGDVEERNSQVALMYEIYRYSSLNLIWLGESDDDTSTALSSIRQIRQEMLLETENLAKAQEMLFNDRGVYLYSADPIAAPFDGEAVVRYYSSPWFSRLWIVQEAALPTDSICFCGEYQISLAHVVGVAAWIRYKHVNMYLPLTEEGMRGLNNACNLFQLMNRQQGRYARMDGFSFSHLLEDLRTHRTSDQRDHVYGMLGLARHHGLFEDIPPLLSPDYGKNTADVFRDATLFVYSNRIDRHFLHNKSLQTLKQPGWPTWLPNFNADTDAEDQPQEFHIDGYEANVGGRARNPKSLPSDPNVLLELGMIVSIVSQISDVCAKELLFKGALQKPSMEFIASFPSMDAADHSETRDIMKAVTVTAGVDHRRRRWDLDECYEGYRAFKSVLAERGVVPSGSQLTGESSSQTVLGSHWHTAVSVALSNRRLFTTAQDTLGLGPPSMESGDVVAILYGCSVPVVLRRLRAESNEFELVGDCYIYGIMDGEAVTAHYERGEADVEFALR